MRTRRSIATLGLVLALGLGACGGTDTEDRGSVPAGGRTGVPAGSEDANRGEGGLNHGATNGADGQSGTGAGAEGVPGAPGSPGPSTP